MKITEGGGQTDRQTDKQRMQKKAREKQKHSNWLSFKTHY